MSKISGFLKDVVSEMRKVSWPKRKELTKVYNCCSCDGYIHGGLLCTYKPRYIKFDGMVPCVIKIRINNPFKIARLEV